MTQSVCCPICIVELSGLSEFEVEGHIQQCLSLYEELKKRHQRNDNSNSNNNSKNTNQLSLQDQRRADRIKHARSVDAWRSIIKPMSSHSNSPNEQKRHTQKREAPAFRRVRGSNIVVNCFNYDAVARINDADAVHFLTHFSHEYYVGLSCAWRKPIYCSAPTAKLLKHVLRLCDDVLRPLPLNTRTRLPDANPTAWVTLLAANNQAPGAVVLLLDIAPHRHRRRTAKANAPRTALHNWLVAQNAESDHKEQNDESALRHDLYCGDFRIDGHDAFQRCRQLEIRTLYLDTTYFHKRYAFQRHSAVATEIERVIKASSGGEGQRVCFVFGIVFLERQALLLRLAQRLKQRVLVSKSKLRVLEALGEDAWFGSEDEAQAFQTTPLKHVSFKSLRARLEADEAFDRIVAFKLVTPKGSACKTRKMTKGAVTIYTVPCADHCDFEELVDFVRFVEPMKIVPTANLKEATQCIAKYFK